jgi:acyl carrier protein
MKDISQIIELIRKMKDSDEIQHDTVLVGGILDSFDLLTLVTEIESNYEINIPLEEVIPENFETPETIYKLLRKL